MNTINYRRSGYSILELMISLVLMATLMMVAWSILGTYRDAEQRGWNQTYQMQVIRISREWLESDAASLMEPRGHTRLPSDEPNSFSSSSSELKPFKGNQHGFEVDVIPSLDPIAWLREITRANQPLASPTQTQPAANTATAIDPVAVHRLRYQIVAGAVARGTAADAGEALFDIQRERIPLDRWSTVSSSSSSEQLLTTEDLYRTRDEELPTDSDPSAENRTTTLRNLITPRFRYSDGNEWLSQWDSQLKGSLPRAIELSFDLPSASTDYETVEPAADGLEELAADDFASDAFSPESLVEVDPPIADSGADDALARDVRIVVLIPGSASQGVQDE